jgi:diaminopimelate epimerase
MRFAKLQATGNDFVLVDARDLEGDWSRLAGEICDRRFGVGADGLLLLLRSGKANLRMRMFNPDGSEAEACGNGLRCLVSYAVETGLLNGTEAHVETLAGVRKTSITGDGSVEVGMGVPAFSPADIPVVVDGRAPDDLGPVVDYPVTVAGWTLSVGCLSMGNPHAVCFLESPVAHFPLPEVGPMIEHHPAFPNRVNFEIVNFMGEGALRCRVWERGAGETLSCGSGACAVAVMAKLKGLTETPVNVEMPGGTLTVRWDGAGEVFLSGPARLVFTGEWER